MKQLFYTLFFTVFATQMIAQTQNIRGTITDKDSKMSIPGANVAVVDLDPIKGAVTDINGRFKITDIPVGRHTIQVSFVGYATRTLQNVELSAGKELILNVSLQENIEMDEVVVEADKGKEGAQNKMASVSARTFSIEETKRYAGSLNDVARMAQNFAGVQGANDSRNDIIVRGNSPIGILYRLEGIDIPNPNHFALNGTTGGPISMLNNNMLDNSDFMTGAFPAEYGNAIAGVFDLKLRTGNNEKHEFLGQIGFNGFELMAEGPINKEKYSSFVVNARYSNLALFKKMGLNFGTGTAVPTYEDMSFKLNFPNKKGKNELWGIGGTSKISMLDEPNKGNNLFSRGGENLWFKSKIGAAGFANTYYLNDKSYLKTSLSIDATYNGINSDTLNFTEQQYYPWYRNRSLEGKQTFNVIYNNKINARNLIKAGVYSQRKFFNLCDSISIRQDTIHIAFINFDTIIPAHWVTLTNFNGATYFIQPFAQWQFRPNEKLTLNTGIHTQYFVYNNNYTFEPRLGFKYQLNDKNTISFGAGVHNQLVPTRLYFHQQIDQYGAIVKDENGNPYIPNKNLQMIRSKHLVIGYDRSLGKNSRLKLESYYQYLDNVPVNYLPNYYSILNFGANFNLSFPDTLLNNGTGENYGIEMTLERFLTKGFYYLVTTSIFDSYYTGSDGIKRNTAFNGNFTFNALAGKEFYFKNKNADKSTKSSLLIDLKTTLNGGHRYIPVDFEASKLAGKAVYNFDQAFMKRYPNYFRIDIKVGYKLNGKKITQEWALNIQNVTNRRNIFTQSYDAKTEQMKTTYQIGILPIMQYRILF